MDILLVNNAARIDKEIAEIKRKLIRTLDNIERGITPLIMEEPDEELRDELLDSVQEIVDKLEDAVISCPKKNTFTKLISNLH